MIPVTNVDHFLAISDLTCYLEYIGIGVICCTVPPDSVRIPNIGVATKRLLHQWVKNTGVVLVPYHIWKCIPATISGNVDIPEVPRYYLL